MESGSSSLKERVLGQSLCRIRRRDHGSGTALVPHQITNTEMGRVKQRLVVAPDLKEKSVSISEADRTYILDRETVTQSENTGE